MIGIGVVVDGRYRIVEELGRGGMSIVYLAVNERSNKQWAIKAVSKAGLCDSQVKQKRLQAETELLKGLHHRYLPELVDVIDSEDGLLIVMDYIEGKSLKVLMEEQAAAGQLMQVEEILKWGCQLCEVLDYLHTRPVPVIYRDMKPANVIVRANGDIALIDLGAARLFQEGHEADTICLGTPGFAAPEQYGFGQTGPQADIYGLGATLHYLMTGQDPLTERFSFSKLTLCRPELLDGVKGRQRSRILGLEKILERCTRYEAAERYASCGELLRDLRSPESLCRSCGHGYRRRGRYAAAFILVLAGMGLLLLGSRAVERNDREKRYIYYLEQAAVTADDSRWDFYYLAAELKPSDERAYIAMLNDMIEDGDFTGDEAARLIDLLYKRGAGRYMDNLSYLKQNNSGYVAFSYHMGMACYFMAGGQGDRSRAAIWFKNVIDADMTQLDMGIDREEKENWQSRAEILSRIGHYYQQTMGQKQQMEDDTISYVDYWDELMAMLAEADKVNGDRLTVLRIYHEVVLQIFDRAAEFKNAAGIGEAVLLSTLAQVETALEKLQDGAQPVDSELINAIWELLDKTHRNIEVIYEEEAE